MRAQPAGTLRCVPGIMRRLFRRLFAYAVCVLRLRRFYHRGRQGALLFCRFLERAGAAPAGIGSAHAWTAGPGRRLGSVGSAHAWTAASQKRPRRWAAHGSVVEVTAQPLDAPARKKAGRLPVRSLSSSYAPRGAF